MLRVTWWENFRTLDSSECLTFLTLEIYRRDGIKKNTKWFSTKVKSGFEGNEREDQTTQYEGRGSQLLVR